jgi:hypothetical protein
MEARIMELRAEEIRFVVGAEGKPTAVLVDITTWEKILETLEDAEDITLVKETLALLDSAWGDLEKAGFIPWEKAKAELGSLDDAKE